MKYKPIARIAYSNVIHKTRKYSFLYTVGLCIILSLLYLPTDKSLINVLNFGGYRGIYNSSWIGTGIALLTSIFLGLIGFYYIRNTISEDARCDIGSIIASTSISKFEYCLGKFLSNFLNLTMIAFIMSIMCIFLQLIRAEDSKLIFGDIFLPFIIITIPTILVVSAIAVLFDSNAILSGFFGNILYFFLWLAFAFFAITGKAYDLLGASYILPTIMNDLKNVMPDYNMSYTVIGNDKYKATFLWNGIKWTSQMVCYRYTWIFAAIIICIVASILFNRSFICKKSYRKLLDLDIYSSYNIDKIEKTKNDYTLYTPIRYKFNLIDLIIANIKANVSGYFWMWYIIIFFLYFFNIIYSNKILSSVIFLYTLPFWSYNKIMKYNNRIMPITFTTPYYADYHIIAMFLSNTILYTLVGSFLIIKSIIANNYIYIALLVSSAMLIASLSLLINKSTKDAKYFEAFFVIIWYIGPLQNIYPLDFVNFTNVVNCNNLIIMYLGTSLLSLILTRFLQKKYYV